MILVSSHSSRHEVTTSFRRTFRHSVAAATLAALLACQHSGSASTPQRQSAEAARVSATISADSGWAPYWTGQLLISPSIPDGPTPIRTERGPVYPDSERSEGHQAVAILAMIIDTVGEVIVPSVRFVRVPPPAFRRSLCEFAWRVRFHPARVNERATAALVIMPFTFALNDNPIRPLPWKDVEKLLVSLTPEQRHAWLSKMARC